MEIFQLVWKPKEVKAVRLNGLIFNFIFPVTYEVKALAELSAWKLE